MTRAASDTKPVRGPIRRWLRRTLALALALCLLTLDRDNNLAQVRQLLTRCADQPSLLAGDFNAEPGDVSIRALQDSGRFSGEIEGSPTYSSRDPRRRIDYILGPNTWIVLEHRVIPNEVSDHSAVFTRFRVKTR